MGEAGGGNIGMLVSSISSSGYKLSGRGGSGESLRVSGGVVVMIFRDRW